MKKIKMIGLAYILGSCFLANAAMSNSVVSKQQTGNRIKTSAGKVKKDISLQKAEQAIKTFNKSMDNIQITDEVQFMLDNSILQVVDFLGMGELLGENRFTPESGKLVISSNTTNPDENLKKAIQALKKLFSSLEKIKTTPETFAFLYSYVQNAAGDLGKKLPNIKDISIKNGKISYTIDSDNMSDIIDIKTNVNANIQ